MTRIVAFASMSALSAMACRAADDAGAAAPTPPPGLAEFEFPNLPGKRSFDCGLIPSEVRLNFLKAGVRGYIANRLNSLHTRYEKDPKVIAWNAYDAATKADALQTAVPKPESARPAAPDYEAGYTAAIKALVDGDVRRQSDEPKARATRDPLIATVTDVVVREVFASKRIADPKYTFLQAKAEVGGDGIKYLNAMIDAKVEAGADRTQLEALRDGKYVNPAKAMLGLVTDKKTAALPSIL